VDNHLRTNVTSRLFVKKDNPSDGFAQARNQLGTPGGAKSFLRGAQFLSYVQSGPEQAWGTRGGEEFSDRDPNFSNYVQ